MNDTQNKYTYASIVPLIGGESLGVMEAMNGQMPEYVLSYSPFANNDNHYIQYIRGKGWTGDYVHLDEQPDYSAPKVDVVNSVCPCAGLSSLSVSSSADSAVNEWLYTTAEYVLDKIGPNVFWGENAPRLYSKMGKPVADKLFLIGQKYGYSLNLYYTESRLHGLCQKRGRTFYFFTKSTTAPIFEWYNVPGEPVENIFKQEYVEGDPMAVQCSTEDPADNAWAAYAMHKNGVSTIRELYDKIDATKNLITWSDRGMGDNLDVVADWMDANGFPKYASRARAMQLKINDGKGYWAHGITLAKGIIPSLIGTLPHALINPFTQKYLTIRDCLRIMKMPEDFNLATDKPTSQINHICQNVPLTTARDMMLNVIKYLDGNVRWSESNYTKQSNKNKTVEYPSRALEPGNSHELDEFFNLHSKKNLL
jgi:site-specific DNA-cytosine methylase